MRDPVQAVFDLYQRGEKATALARAERLLATRKTDIRLLHLTAIAHLEQGAHAQAEQRLGQLLKLNPDDAIALVTLGNLCQARAAFDQAEAHYRRAAQLRPDLANIHNNLGILLKKQKRLAEAEAAFRQALQADPDCVESLLGLGNLLVEAQRHAEAEPLLRQVLTLQPDEIRALNNLANLLADRKQYQEAEIRFRQVLALRPEQADARCNLGQLLLAQGRFAEGWRWYETRYHPERLEPVVIDSAPGLPWWQGGDPAGKTLLILPEQGVGDAILHASMLPDLLARGARVILECDERLVPLFARSFPGCRCIGTGREKERRAAEAECDFVTPLGSLGQWLRSDGAAFPQRNAFLAADRERSALLRQRYLPEGRGLLTGIAWHSANPTLGKKKSMALAELHPLLSLPGITFVDLQYGDTGAERAAFTAATGIGILHDDTIDQMADLDGFAAQVAAMDAVVTISNTTAHMAGALGVPTLLMLWPGSLWYWMVKRDDSPWYPSMRLFRAEEGAPMELDPLIRFLLGRVR
ncbi:MAG: tetratricopeptide repeat protein [Magnetococcales bacterium]|nr:tetratricopeptide repeat protein [Magnetococcales bacterium]